MSRARILSKGNARFAVEGALDFSTVTGLAAEGDRLLRGRGPMEIDLGGVSAANSAGLALLLEWLDLAGRRGLRLRYLNPPESLVRLAGLSNLGGVLPMIGIGAERGRGPRRPAFD